MDKPRRRRGPRPTQADKGGSEWGPSQGYLAVALGIAAAGLIIWWLPSSSDTDVAADTAKSASLPAATSGALPAWPLQSAAGTSRGAPGTRAAPGARAEGVDPTPDLSHYVAPGEKPTMKEVIEGLHKAGIHTGLGAFSPPGTRPPKIGLAVPEDFVLPPGYVRHYQATDDGQRIEPILMFSPDRQSANAASGPNENEIPKDRVVPPDLAPPGLPIRNIVVPPPAEPGGTGS